MTENNSAVGSTVPVPTASFRNLLPSYRFVRIEETILHGAHDHLSSLDTSAIRVLNWNIAKNNHDRAWIEDFQHILNRYQPHLIFLQEVRMCATVKRVELAEWGWSFAPNFIDAFHNSYAGVLTATKSACLKQKAIVTQHGEPVTKTPKVSLITEYSLMHSRKTLLTVNTHLINFVELAKFKAQLHEIEQAISAWRNSEGTALHSGAVIFSGDFNTWNRPRWTMLVQMTQRLGLTRANFPPHEAQNLKRFLLSPPLDHIFYRGLQQNYLQARVLNDITSSDHKPMLVEFYE